MGGSKAIYVSEKEVSERTNIALQTLRNWRSTGQGLPYYKVGRKVLYRLDETIQFIENHRIEPREQGAI